MEPRARAGGRGRPEPASVLVGVISDTHGVIRPEALATLRGCAQILHAGDVGSPEVLQALQQIAPVVAVRGNVDRGDLARRLPATVVVEIGGLRLGVTHNLHLGLLDPQIDRLDVLVYGHSHRPGQSREKDCLLLNPGSAGPRRFGRPATVGLLRIRRGRARAELVSIA
jgi:putative phosphoesterase